MNPDRYDCIHLAMPVGIVPIRTRSCVRIIDHALGTQSAAVGIDEVSRRVQEPGISLDVRHCIEPRQRLLQKSLVLSIRAAATINAEFRDPDRKPKLVIRLLHVVLQVAEGVNVVVPVNVDEVEGVACAVAHEVA